MESTNCTMMASDNATALLTVNDAPSITIPPEDATVLAPEAAVFNCSAEGFPLPSISWVRVDRDGNETLFANGLLGNVMISKSSDFIFTLSSILTISLTDVLLNSNFVCVASNSISSVNATALLTVNTAPNITIPPENTTVTAPEAAMFTCSAEGFPRPSISWFRMDRDGTQTDLVDEVDNVMIFESSSTFTITSSLTLSPTDVLLHGVSVRWRVFNDIGSDEGVSYLTVYVPAVITQSPPDHIVAVDGDLVSVGCTALGNSRPSEITWTITAVDGSVFTATQGIVGFSIEEELRGIYELHSTLNFTVLAGHLLRGNGTHFTCVASNELDFLGGHHEAVSSPALLIIGDPPERPVLLDVSAGTTSALIYWSMPFSLLPITGYIISIVEIPSGESIVEEVGVSLDYNITSLRPGTEYTVTVVAVNRAGEGEGITTTFFTQEDVPIGLPQNIMTSSTELGLIRVTWTSLLSNETNGVITNYTVQYRPVLTPLAVQVVTVFGTSAVINISAGDAYLISVAGATSIGIGPFSEEVIQTTIPIPPTFPPDPLPIAGPPSVSTIPITLPSVPGAANSFSHYWVVVIRLSSSFDTSVDPSVSYPDNSTFTSYTSDVPEDTSYIVAEISAANYQPLTTFVLGDEEGTLNINDFPALYINGALQQGARYTAFVRAFTGSIPDGVRLRRQSEIARQYNVFVSSPFQMPVTTVSTNGEPDSLSIAAIGGIAGGVLGAVVLLTCVVIFILMLVICRSSRKKVVLNRELPEQPAEDNDSLYENMDAYQHTGDLVNENPAYDDIAPAYEIIATPGTPNIKLITDGADKGKEQLSPTLYENRAYKSIESAVIPTKPGDVDTANPGFSLSECPAYQETSMAAASVTANENAVDRVPEVAI